MQASTTTPHRPRLVSIGDLVLDIVVLPEVAVATGTDVTGTIRFRAGGSAANTCRAFVLLGGVATFIGVVGGDEWGRRLVAALRADGVDVRAPKVVARTARLVALISGAGERSFITERGAADHLRPAQVKRSWFRHADVLHVPAYSLMHEPLSAASAAACGYAREARALVAVDLASRRPLVALGRAAARARIAALSPDVLLANADEVAALVGRGNSKRLVELAPVVVIKEGLAGCRILWRSPRAAGEVLEMIVAAKPLRAIDTTGAGDAFDAGFLHHLASARISAATTVLASPTVLRRAAVAGHRAAYGLLTRLRPELAGS